MACCSTLDVEDSGHDGLQSPNVYNRHLPYAGSLEAEAAVCWSRIKEHLAKAVLMSDIKDGALYWSQQIFVFLKLYGYCFSKKDHIHVIQLHYELVTIPDLELFLVRKFGDTLVALLRKTKVLSREDLVLPWKPLYQLFMRTAYSKRERVGLQCMPKTLFVSHVVHACRAYFANEATQEMIDEWWPWVSPLGSDVGRAMRLLDCFLPTTILPSHHHMGFKLWFKDLMKWYEGGDGSPYIEKYVISLLARVGAGNVGFVDWEPHARVIFARTLKSSSLQVGPAYLHKQAVPPAYESKTTSQLIVSMIDQKNSVMQLLEKLVKALESYFHPSNSGTWTKGLHSFLLDLVDAFVKRVFSERYRRPIWFIFIPDEAKLTEEQITSFVNIVKPVAFLGMFCKQESVTSLHALHGLACLRPELVIPELVDRLYQSSETLTEPHRLHATLLTTMAVARPMVQGGPRYPAGRLHVIPILNLVLPGIDANDHFKTMGALHVIRVLAMLTPMVDCSEASQWHPNLTDIEAELCSHSAQFQDFAFQFLDRLFVLIDNSSMDHNASAAAVEKASVVENVMEDAVPAAAQAVFRQLSCDIFKAAWDKLLGYLKGSVFEVLVSGRLAACLTAVAVDAYPQITLPSLLPYCCERICQLADEHEHTVGAGRRADEERLDKELQWLLLLLSESVQCDGAVLVTYASCFESVMDRALHLVAKEGYEYAALALRRFLKSLTKIYPLEQHNVDEALWNMPLSERLPIEDWGVGCNAYAAHIKWHEPNEEELHVASRFVNKYLARELAALESVATGKTAPMDRHELERRLVIVFELLSGSGACLGRWSAEEINLSKYAAVATVSNIQYAGVSTYDITLNGRNTRQKVLEVMHQLLDHLLSSPGADSAKPLVELVGVYRVLLFYHGTSDTSIEESEHELSNMKYWTSNMLSMNRHLRAAAVEHVRLQHELRLKESGLKVFTALHRDAFCDLFRLATSQYDDVRKKAQSVLSQGFGAYPGSHNVVLQELLTALAEDASASEQRFKGALNIVLGDSACSMAASKQWSTISSVWPALVSCRYSEKPDVQKLIEEIKKKIDESFETLALSIEVSSGSIAAAKAILSTELADSLDYNSSIALAKQRCADWSSSFAKLTDALVSRAVIGNIHWKQYETTMKMLASLIRYDVMVSPDLGRLLARNLVHDSYVLRKLTVRAIVAVLYQRKLRRSKSWLSADKDSCSSTLCYNTCHVPNTEEKWNETRFVDKAHLGYNSNCKLLVYDDQSAACTKSKADDELTMLLKEDGFLPRLLKFMSLVEDPKEDWYANGRLFKGLFRNYGIGLLDSFKLPLLELARDPCHITEAGRHRCLSQVVCGIVHGSKHWSFDEVMALWDWLLPFLKDCTQNISSESMDQWSTMFVTVTRSRDPRRLFRMFNYLMKEIESCNSESTSLELSSRLRYLHCALDGRDWRNAELLHKSLDFVQPLLAHPFQTVRSRIGRFLVTIFQHDYGESEDPERLSPVRALFIRSIMPRLDFLKEKMSTEPAHAAAADDSAAAPLSDRAQALLLMKTVLIWLDTNFNRPIVRKQWTTELMSFLPLIFPLVSDTSDTELRQDCFTAIAKMSHPTLPSTLAVNWVDVVEEVSKQQSWQGRFLLLGHMQSFIFQNLFSLSEASIKTRIRAVLLRLLEDEQVEVRQLACETLSGALQCGYLVMDQALLSHFYRLCSAPAKGSAAKVTKASIADASSDGSSCLVKRHAGVLGMCACIRSCPYDVPDFLPDLLMRLTQHAHDPQPIQKTVKETMGEFKRTHYDNWLEHKQKFSDDQLVVLTDILISHNYYA